MNGKCRHFSSTGSECLSRFDIYNEIGARANANILSVLSSLKCNQGLNQ